MLHAQSPDSILALYNLDMEMHVHNPSTWGVVEGGSEVQSHPWLHCEFQAKLGYTV